jgi:hypothetical protein
LNPKFFVFRHPCYAADEDNPPDLDYMVWRYCDTGELVDQSPKRRCPLCKELPIREGCDPCLGKLPGVRAACCGHGVKKGRLGQAYVLFESGRVIRGRFD